MSELTMTTPENEWLDEDAGPVVRPYAMTGGRTRVPQVNFDLIAVIVTADVPVPDDAGLGPEHMTILDRCRRPLSVAEVASEIDLPLGVARVLLGDLLGFGLITVSDPAPVAHMSNESVLREVIHGLHAL